MHEHEHETDPHRAILRALLDARALLHALDLQPCSECGRYSTPAPSCSTPAEHRARVELRIRTRRAALLQHHAEHE